VPDAGYGRYDDNSAESEDDGDGCFTFNGLRNLMQLQDLTAFAISKDSCLFRDLRSRDRYNIGDLEEFGGWLDSRLQDLLSSNAAWQAYLLQEWAEHLAGARCV
jgi:hypothetical protein